MRGGYKVRSLKRMRWLTKRISGAQDTETSAYEQCRRFTASLRDTAATNEAGGGILVIQEQDTIICKYLSSACLRHLLPPPGSPTNTCLFFTTCLCTELRQHRSHRGRQCPQTLFKNYCRSRAPMGVSNAMSAQRHAAASSTSVRWIER